MALNPTHKTFDIKAAQKVNPVFIKKFGLEKNPPFGLDPSSGEFAWKIFEFQLADECVRYGLAPLVDDGVFGPKAYEAYQRVVHNNTVNISQGADYIFFDGKKLPISAKVITPDELGGMSFEDIPSPNKGYSIRKNLQKARTVVIHHDACTSAIQCFKVLATRKLSTGWCIDNDGTIYQFFSDVAKWRQWATGAFNDLSLPLDISSVADPTYASLYKKRGLSVPPIITKTWNKKPMKMLAITAAQQASTLELIKVLTKYMQIPLRVPRKNGIFIDGYSEYVFAADKSSKFIEEGGGIVGHLHVDKNKWDAMAFDWEAIK